MLISKEQDKDFYDIYFEIIKYRLTQSSLAVEGYEKDDSLNSFYQLSAINYMFENFSEKDISHFEFTSMLCNLIDLITGGEYSNFRNDEVIVMGSKVPRTKPAMIRNDLWYLLDDYQYQIANMKNPEEIYEIEANFHIRFLHIHPFGDGNGRVARILLLFQLISNNVAPVFINEQNKREYCDYIENGDVKGLATMFKKLSEKELQEMLEIYRINNEKNRLRENLMNDEEEQQFRKLNK